MSKMLKTRYSRQKFVGYVGLSLFLLGFVALFTMGGYYWGLVDGGVVHTGWDGAWRVGLIAVCAIVGFAALAGIAFLVHRWIEKGDGW